MPVPQPFSEPHFSPRVQKQLNELFEQRGVYVIDVVVRGSDSRRVLEVYADAPDGITLELCGELSNELGAIFEAENVFKGAYRLDVSSPGVDRPLRHSWQYARNVGRLVNLELADKRSVKGRIGAVSESAFVLEPAHTKQSKTAAKKAAKEVALNPVKSDEIVLPAEIRFDVIHKAVVQLEFAE